MRKPSKKVLSIILALYLGLASYLFTVIIKYINPSIDPNIGLLIVVITPCCSVYVHIDHMLEWLKVQEICPNCK